MKEFTAIKENLLHQWPTVKRAYGAQLILLVTFVIALLPLEIREVLAFSNSTVETHWWSIITAQLTHLNWPHWFMNASGLVALMWLSPLYLVNFRSLILIFSWMLFVSAGFMVWQVDYLYFGFSGVLYGWIALVLIVNKQLDLFGRLLTVALMTTKIANDYFHFFDFNDYSKSWLESDISIESHILGISYAFLVILVLLIKMLLVKLKPHQ
jgi:rhomboid family GlyGly-CTERM serine protease